jgi:tetratricopeptide (TPR) repeat protein
VRKLLRRFAYLSRRRSVAAAAFMLSRNYQAAAREFQLALTAVGQLRSAPRHVLADLNFNLAQVTPVAAVPATLARTLLANAQVYRALRREADAMRHYEMCIAVAPDFRDASFQLAEMLSGACRTLLAIACFHSVAWAPVGDRAACIDVQTGTSGSRSVQGRCTPR